MSGVYSPSGALNVTAIDGQTFTGVYAPDGSYNVVVSNTTGELPSPIVVTGATTEEPQIMVGLDSDTEPRLSVGLDSSDVPTISMGDGTNPPDTFLKRISAGLFGLINGTSPMGLLLYNTFTSSSVYERGFVRWVSNALQIGTEHVGGALRNIAVISGTVTFNISGSNRLVIGSSTLSPSSDNTYNLGGGSGRFLRVYMGQTTVASLPTASSNTGARTFVSDALGPTFGSTVVGGGAVYTPVYSNGTNWIVG